MKRQASIDRSTKETKIKASVDLDGTGAYDIATGIGFLDHMLEQLARHSLVDITLKTKPGARAPHLRRPPDGRGDGGRHRQRGG